MNSSDDYTHITYIVLFLSSRPFLPVFFSSPLPFIS
jgi:hypothetical protein